VTVEQLRALIAGGETLDVEFKDEDRERLSDSDLIDAVVCMSNRSGSELGWILVGVEDDGRVTGARPRHEAGTTDVLRVQALIANRTRPSVAASASLLALGDSSVLVIEVPVSTVPVAGVMELCHLTGPQAYRLLRRLVVKELLQLEMKRGRGARYARKAR
jgi:ATP-dependent DNA helicase RecG